MSNPNVIKIRFVLHIEKNSNLAIHNPFGYFVLNELSVFHDLDFFKTIIDVLRNESRNIHLTHFLLLPSNLDVAVVVFLHFQYFRAFVSYDEPRVFTWDLKALSVFPFSTFFEFVQFL